MYMLQQLQQLHTQLLAFLSETRWGAVSLRIGIYIIHIQMYTIATDRTNRTTSFQIHSKFVQICYIMYIFQPKIIIVQQLCNYLKNDALYKV